MGNIRLVVVVAVYLWMILSLFFEACLKLTKAGLSVLQNFRAYLVDKYGVSIQQIMYARYLLFTT